MTPTATGAGLPRLIAIMDRLRAEDGCPWDRAQTLLTLKGYLIEETLEVLDVMTTDATEHCEELGDLLFQVVFQSRIRAEEGAFSLDDVIASIADKLERRHPHVFGDETIDDPAEVARRWESIKTTEGKSSRPSDVATDWSALVRAQKVGSRASRVGFDWPDIAGPVAKVHEELREVEEVLTAPDTAGAAARHHEIGDLLFSVVNVARHLGVSAEAALHDATARFGGRVERVQRTLEADGTTSKEASPETLDRLWELHKHARD